MQKSIRWEQLATQEIQLVSSSLLLEVIIMRKSPVQVFEHVYQTIIDRKNNPKEGSYTNYLFEQGQDKILKKIGEEATGIVIASKNPNPEELKTEMADFLYHAMVLMVEKGITWEDVTNQLLQK